MKNTGIKNPTMPIKTQQSDEFLEIQNRNTLPDKHNWVIHNSRRK